MSQTASQLRAAAHPLHNDGVTPTAPTRMHRPEKCEFPLHIGLFFDGTGNNQDWAEPGLLTANGFTHRTTFLKAQCAQLAKKIHDTRHPKLVEVFVDVFGFSRGAAQARVFCQWLTECLDDDTLAGVTTHIRFLGLFDTVAAVGLGPAAGPWTHGHGAWAEAKHLRISPMVRHCEHYVAMHEQRESFPLEDVQTPGDQMPENCRQFRFPGMHADLGGGYLPDEQGKGPSGADDEKLSQIPLNLMFEAAKAAYAPLDKSLAFSKDRD